MPADQSQPARAEASVSAKACPVLASLGGVARARSRLHALHPARPGDEAAATGFALGLLYRLDEGPSGPRSGPILWVQHRSGLAEAGRPYGAGLAALGLDPARIVLLAVSSAMDALAAAEMGLALGGLAGVLAELPARLPSGMLKRGQRLALRAEATATPCLLLHACARPAETPVASRWLVAVRPTADRRQPFCDLVPAVDLELQKNRFGPTGRLSVTWVCHDRCFVSLPLPGILAAAADTGALAAVSADRPDQTQSRAAA